MTGALQGKGLQKLDGLVGRDFRPRETAEFWRSAPGVQSGEVSREDIETEVFFFPASTHVEKDGSFTNTQRLLQWHYKAVEPKEDCRSELWFYYHLGRKIREKLAASQDPKNAPVLELTWHYPTSGEHEEPSAEAVLAEVNGWDDQGQAL